MYKFHGSHTSFLFLISCAFIISMFFSVINHSLS
nr:MAG TPA: hypothetical protein [Caudoviricetes sp.]